MVVIYIIWISNYYPMVDISFLWYNATKKKKKYVKWEGRLYLIWICIL